MSMISTQPQHGGIALIVEDEVTNRMILKALLKKRGYHVIEAENGAEAIQLFQQQSPNIIFMDVMMPVMDGYEATTEIKRLAGDEFIPIIFLTAMSDEKALARCVEVGGDDFLSKPYSFTVLSAKVKAMERIRILHQDTRMLYSRMQRDEEIAEQVFSGAVIAGNVGLDRIHSLLKPASVFSGDLMLTAYAPSQDMHVLLGDFTGHGLAAALGALPTSEVFRSMTGKGFAPQQILSAINNKLYNLLPTGMFLATQFVKVDHQLDHISIINCGMPDCFLVENESMHIKHQIVSKSLPLGIAPDIDFKDDFHHLRVKQGDRVILATDGVTEARNSKGELFGQERFIQAIIKSDSNTYILDKLARDLEAFCQDAPQDDDISVVEVPLFPDLLPGRESPSPHIVTGGDMPHKLFSHEQPDCIEFQLIFYGSQLRQADPVPILINYIQETAGLHEHRRPLFTILTELYINALDHGVLQMDSKLKQGEEGFTNYFQQREQRLEALTEGKIRIALRIHRNTDGGYIVITMEDSGHGFDYASLSQEVANETIYSGRGILLVKSLVKQLQFFAPGNKAEAIYVWEDNL
ncbi:MAG: histidine kinase [gamma proteobacterium symbiont of Ctena orbiculata]|nr:MAG: histidine kinase [gamma proteobacterium symbiont of Ctena orbiculata]PVV20190.1 MAG: histidine kinase [gamma proteobacterium symbiont of Ctena orbiculata]PVV23043.1 MAG: histidine kinase [gamma proteobacterium symbiont of Ctena orbiculata]